MSKRIFDVFGSLLGLIFFSPILLIVAGCVWLKMGSPVLFSQERPGKYGRPFRMIKFRTMRNEVNGDRDALSDSERLTRLGRVLRASSLDELPELWNVLIGEMSLVGPRPLLMEYLPLYSQYQLRRHELRPGITGWAQINGRNAISWSEKFALDVWYVDNHHLWLDLKIIWLTLCKVIKREGISAAGEATMPKFTGENQ